jgi:hypothetical protein
MMQDRNTIEKFSTKKIYIYIWTEKVMMRLPPFSLENVPWREQETELVGRHGGLNKKERGIDNYQKCNKVRVSQENSYTKRPNECMLRKNAKDINPKKQPFS